VEVCVKVTVERPSDTEATLTIEIEWSELEKASDRTYRKLAQRYNVPGFRPGHAPRSILERMVGKETLYQEGLDDLVDESYRRAIREHDLKPAAAPTLDTPPLQMNQPYTFVVHLPVLAPVHLGEYRSMHVERPSVEVSDEDVAKVLAQMQQDQALWLPVERPAQVGDQIIADLKLTVGDRTISDLHDNEFLLAESREGLFSGMDAQLVGMSEGETKEFTTTIPADYANDKLAGQEAHYTVTLKGVKYRELPEIDDELAKSASDHQTLDDLRVGIRADLLKRRQADARRDFRERVINAVIEQAQVEVHPAMVKDEADDMMREMGKLLESSGLTLEQYLEMTSKTQEEYRADLMPDARDRVKRHLVLDAIAAAENIEVSDQEIENWLAVMNALGGGQRLRLAQLTAGQREYIASQLRRDQATARLIEAAGGELDAETAPESPEQHEHPHDATSAAEDVTAGALAAARAAQDATTTHDGAELASATPALGETAPPTATPNGKTDSAAEASLRTQSTPTVPAAETSAGAAADDGTEVPERGA
jgi:trigger factor